MERRLGIHWLGLAGWVVLAAAAQALQTNLPPIPPLPPLPRYQNAAAGIHLRHLPPVEYFRALLGMSPAQRERALASRAPADREILLAKLREYETLPRGIREARLCQTELHWELEALMKLAPRDRTNRLREVSPLYRPMVDGLLREWDKAPADLQKALLEKQSFIGVYLRMQGAPAAEKQAILDKLPPERRAHWAEDMNRWQALPAPQRAQLCAQFQRFCALSSQEQKETVNALSETEREEMEEALQAFHRLPPAQRAQFINSFSKFATLSPGERSQFLKNAARWDAMTARERRLWRDLVHVLPPMPPVLPHLPLLPPGMEQRMLRPPPPLPPNVTAPVIIARATNQPG
jgi:hypothetical protein